MMQTNVFRSLLQRWVGSEVERRVKLALTTLDGFYERNSGPEPRDRFDYDREEVLRRALEAWRTNPLARRIVELTSQYVVGGGLTIASKNSANHAFLQTWWQHPLNKMAVRCFEWCDELTRAGELFLSISTDAAGMSYVRAIPASDISEITTAANDRDQELHYSQKGDGLGVGNGRVWSAWEETTDRPDPQGNYPPVMLHYAVNRPAGAVRGESDLAPLLRWLARYSSWLEDRARLNRYRQTFLFVVKARFSSEAERMARQAALNRTPPPPGSILVTDESETWETLQPRLESDDANTDGLALKKMIASGAGLPLHFLAEPESATRTTAESAGGPTFRRFEQRQVYFLWLIADLARVALQRRAWVDRRIDPHAPVEVRGADISARDNASLAVAASTLVGAFTDLRDRGLIDDRELLRLAYRFAGEVVDLDEMLSRGRAAGPTQGAPTLTAGRPVGVKVDPITGEIKQ